jgi:hypothetical protein
MIAPNTTSTARGISPETRPTRRLSSLVVLLVGLSAAASGEARAWGAEGHEVIALIAYDHLAPPVRRRVDQLLAEDRDMLTAPDIAARATWADRWRRDHPETAAWHYVDLEVDNPDLRRACRSKRSCVVDKIDDFASELSNPAAPETRKIYALKMVLHLVGDVHQPLHAADAHDRGGNCEQVSYTPASWFGLRVWPTEQGSLDAYWDTVGVRALGRSPKEIASALEQRITRRDVAAWSAGTPSDWAQETFVIGRDVAYRYGGPLACGTGSVTPLSRAYQEQAKQVSGEQLSRAGIRLATLLNHVFSRTS